MFSTTLLTFNTIHSRPPSSYRGRDAIFAVFLWKHTETVFACELTACLTLFLITPTDHAHLTAGTVTWRLLSFLFSSCRSLSPSALSWCLATPCCSRPSTPPRLSPSGWVGPWSPINCVRSQDKFSWINGSRWSKITDAFVWTTGTAERNGLKYKTLFEIICVLSFWVAIDYFILCSLEFFLVFQAIIALRDRFAQVFKPGVVTWVRRLCSSSSCSEDTRY